MFTKSNDLDICPILIQNDTSLNVQPCVKLLGVYIDRSLSFRENISYSCNNAGGGFGCIGTSANISKRKKSKSFIFRHFNYCPTVWHFL